jgi:peptidoglycan/xylan/chitin deacetylase (PgdA/CDA1 family)
MQLDTLADCGYRAIALRDYMDIREQGRSTGDRFVVLTFDDGYQDLVDTALPEVESRGWSCTVFLTSGLVGNGNGWDPDGSGRRLLINWNQAATVAARGIELGAHGVTHANLATLSPEQAQAEIVGSRDDIEQHARCRVSSFAAPYGQSTPALRQQIARCYACAVGTTMAQATWASDRYDLPRIEMWYFRHPARWRAYLEGSMSYFNVRCALRRVRGVMGLSAARA